MKFISIFYYWVYFFSNLYNSNSSILLNKRDAVVWLEKQTISGRLIGFYADQLIASCNYDSFKIFVEKDSTFSFAVTLTKGKNNIVVKTINDAVRTSDTLGLSLGFNPQPVIKTYANVKANQLKLHMQVLKNPWKEKLNFLWSDDPRNPGTCNIINKNDSIAVVSHLKVSGIYYFNLSVATMSDTAKFQTYVIKNKSGIHVFNMDQEHATWIDEAIIYEITPSAFVKDGTYDDITNKLKEIKQLGINTIWLQPVYSSFNKGQGYDIIDYFTLRKDFGTERQLKNLITKAKQLQLKVLFDFVPNHTSIHHPYAQDCIKYGIYSQYYSFYQHEDDGTPYSSFYKKDKYGFVNYFWEDLVNLNYNNEEVQQWIIEACKYWIKKFDIDGYRFDAIWGVNARMPSFSERLKIELKSIKPDLLLLAEDKGAVLKVGESGFDAAYDWTADTSWVSHWSWQYKYDARKNFTIFSHPDVSKRTQMLRTALSNNGSSSKLLLRFIENNDLPRFIKTHPVACTKMAATLLFSLQGIPMIYNGQEIGFNGHPYSKHAVFESHRSIQSLDSNNLFNFYKTLIQLRKRYPALRSQNIAGLPASPEEKIVAFHRWINDERVLVILNMDSIPAKATFNVKTILAKSQHKHIHDVEDIFTKNFFSIGKDLEMQVPMEGYGIRWLLFK